MCVCVCVCVLFGHNGCVLIPLDTKGITLRLLPVMLSWSPDRLGPCCGRLPPSAAAGGADRGAAKHAGRLPVLLGLPEPTAEGGDLESATVPGHGEGGRRG